MDHHGDPPPANRRSFAIDCIQEPSHAVAKDEAIIRVAHNDQSQLASRTKRTADKSERECWLRKNGTLFQAVDNLLIDLTHRRFLDFDDLAVIGHKAVHFYLHVRCLRVDSSCETSLNEGFERTHILDITLGDLIGILELDVTPVAIGLPQMAFETVARVASNRYMSGPG